MGDDHVDRLGVEALQGVKLTSTNRPCGLTIKYLRRESIVYIPTLLTSGSQGRGLSPPSREAIDGETDFPGDHSEGATPVPIPNTAVKPFSPDGTSR